MTLSLLLSSGKFVFLAFRIDFSEMMRGGKILQGLRLKLQGKLFNSFSFPFDSPHGTFFPFWFSNMQNIIQYEKSIAIIYYVVNSTNCHVLFQLELGFDLKGFTTILPFQSQRIYYFFTFKTNADLLSSWQFGRYWFCDFGTTFYKSRYFRIKRFSLDSEELITSSFISC